MCVPPTWEMSKHSIRTGSASSCSAACRPESDSTRCWRRRSALSFSWSSASRALRSASSRIRRLPPRSAARISTAPPRRSASIEPSTLELRALLELLLDDDQRRDRQRGRVVLQEELLRDDRGLLLALVVEVEGLAVGEDAVAHLEDLRVGLQPVDGDRDRVEGALAVGGDALALQQRLDGLQAVALQRRLLVVLLAGGEVHPLLEVLLDLAEAAGEEGDHAVDALAVLLLGHVPDAGRPAALDVVVEAGRAGAPAGLGALAGAEEEDLAQQVERAADALGARVRAEVGAVAPVALAREVDAREVLVQADRDVGVGLVVAQPDVEARPVLLDEVLLREERLGLRVDDERLDVVDEACSAGSGWRSATRRACGSTSPCRRRSRARARRGTGRRRAGPAAHGAARRVAPCAGSRQPPCNRWYGGRRTATLAPTIGSDVYAQEKDDRRGAGDGRRRRRLRRPGAGRLRGRDGRPGRPRCSRTRGIEQLGIEQGPLPGPLRLVQEAGQRERGQGLHGARRAPPAPTCSSTSPPAAVVTRTASTRSARSAARRRSRRTRRTSSASCASTRRPPRSAPGTRRNHRSQPTANKPGLAAKYFLAARSACRSCKIVAADVLDSTNMESWLNGFDAKDKGKASIYGLHNYSDVNRQQSSGTRRLLRRVSGEVWLTETGGILKFLPTFPRSESRQKRSTKYMFKLADRYDTRRSGMRSRITRLYNYQWTGAPQERHVRRRPGRPDRLAALGLQGLQVARGEARLTRRRRDPAARASRAAAGRSVPVACPGIAPDTLPPVHVDAGGREMAISSPDKLLFPDRGETKLDLVRYYLAVAEPLMRAIAGPAGADAAPSAGRDGAVLLPEARAEERAGLAADRGRLHAERHDVERARRGRHRARRVGGQPRLPGAARLALACGRDRASRTSCASTSTRSGPRRSTWSREAASETRALLRELGMDGMPKTTGNRGIHLYVRLTPRAGLLRGAVGGGRPGARSWRGGGPIW